jgi:hypothetical protein
MGKRDKRALSEKSKHALKSFSDALVAQRNGDAVTITANGSTVDLATEKSTEKLAEAIRSGKFAAQIVETEKSKKTKKGKGRGATGQRKSTSQRKRAQVSKMCDTFKDAEKTLKSNRVAKGGMQWSAEDVAKVREYAQSFVDACDERIAVVPAKGTKKSATPRKRK